MESAASCWSQFFPEARRAVNAVWDIFPHCSPPPACFYELISEVNIFYFLSKK